MLVENDLQIIGILFYLLFTQPANFIGIELVLSILTSCSSDICSKSKGFVKSLLCKKYNIHKKKNIT